MPIRSSCRCRIVWKQGDETQQESNNKFPNENLLCEFHCLQFPSHIFLCFVHIRPLRHSVGPCHSPTPPTALPTKYNQLSPSLFNIHYTNPEILDG